MRVVDDRSAVARCIEALAWTAAAMRSAVGVATRSPRVNVRWLRSWRQG